MKTTELNCKSLMIGDLVSYNGAPIKVENIHEDCINYSPDIPYVQEEFFIAIDDVEPIPLTPEILKLNGFEQKTDGWLRCEDKANEFQNYIFIQYRHQGDIRECEINYVNIVKANYLYVINYVHELQHCLHLCGLSELADNLKLE